MPIKEKKAKNGKNGKNGKKWQKWQKIIGVPEKKSCGQPWYISIYEHIGGPMRYINIYTYIIHRKKLFDFYICI